MASDPVGGDEDANARKWEGIKFDNLKTQLSKTQSCPTGPYITGSYGGSVTAAFFAGINVNASINFSRPAAFDLQHPFDGYQVGVTGQVSGMWGVGIFLGAAEQGGAGVSNGPMTPGVSSATGPYAEGDIGLGIDVGGSVQGSYDQDNHFSGASGGVAGRLGTGVGAYGGIGAFASKTYASPAFGC